MYSVDLVAAQEVRWFEGGSHPADKYFSMEMEMLTIT